MKEIIFEDLEFKPHPCSFGEQAKKYFENNYGVSVIFGERFYSNGVDTYELGVLKNGVLDYDNPVANGDVVGHLNKQELMKLINQVANF